MQSNDARMLLQCAVPTALAGAVAAAISGVLAGGKGAVGAASGALVVILFMGMGLAVLQWVSRSHPQLFQAMGLLLYVTQLLLLFVVLAVFQDTTLFDTTAFGLALLAAAIVWVISQAVAHMKAKIMYVDPEPSGGEAAKSAATGTRS
ncbi:hypothetical protein E0L36_12000 [Streptomyces sp. AJS327]|uniref:hypothetical protein n=1 Tax=Streptomyces sp. AJS327 TaxID=2545265 RepID=UPI0015DFE74C|nr:hypothetical protein [Streptomyces sp. AJS327]MBA0051590.1 hypothetical protein [Streptomyces sp. AJS327]